MSDKVEPCEEVPCEAAVVSLDTLLDKVVVLKLKAIRRNDRELFDILDGLLNEQISIIRRDEMSIKTMMSNMEKLEKENEQLKEELNNLKKDETMLYHYYTLARYGGDGV